VKARFLCYTIAMKKSVKIVIISAIALAVVAAVFLCVWFLHVVPAREQKERERLVKEYREAKLARYQEENAALLPGEEVVLFLGDSLTDGCPLETYYPDYKTLNRGIGGDTTFDLEKRLQVSAYDANPKVLVLLIGGNNLYTMFENYETILQGIKQNLPETKVILVSLTAMGGKWAKKNEIAALNNVRIELLAEEYGFYFVDVFTPLFDPETMQVKQGYTADGAHFTAEGYAVVSVEINKAIVAVLQ